MRDRFLNFPGRAALYYKDIQSGREISANADVSMNSASIIKLYVMYAAFRAIARGEASPDERFVTSRVQCVPTNGVITLLSEGIELRLMDLITLMITVSDNTATNMLIDRLTIEAINRAIAELGLRGTKLGRKLFDGEAARRGIRNLTTARDAGEFLERVYARELVSQSASETMMQILLNQQFDGSISFFLDAEVAHKTGDDCGISHDAALVLAQSPFVLCCFGEGVSRPEFKRLTQDAGRWAWDLAGGSGI